MAVAFVGSRMALVSTGGTTSHLVSTNRSRNHSSPLVETSLLTLQAIFVGGTFDGHRALTNESLLMRGWDKGHDWLKYPVLAPSRSGSRVKKEAILSLSKTSSARPGWLNIWTKSHYS